MFKKFKKLEFASKGSEDNKIISWNVAGLYNKNEQFWGYLYSSFDIIILIETWWGEKDWEKMKHKLSTSYEWGRKFAVREGSRGRYSGGLLVGFRKALGLKLEWKERNMWIEVKCTLNNRNWYLLAVYNNKTISHVVDCWNDFIQENDASDVLIVGDLNARIGQSLECDVEIWESLGFEGSG